MGTSYSTGGHFTWRGQLVQSPLFRDQAPKITFRVIFFTSIVSVHVMCLVILQAAWWQPSNPTLWAIAARNFCCRKHYLFYAALCSDNSIMMSNGLNVRSLTAVKHVIDMPYNNGSTMSSVREEVQVLHRCHKGEWLRSLCDYFKIEQNVSAAVTVLLMGVGALLTQRRTAWGREKTTRVCSLPSLVAYTLQ